MIDYIKSLDAVREYEKHHLNFRSIIALHFYCSGYSTYSFLQIFFANIFTLNFNLVFVNE